MWPRRRCSRPPPKRAEIAEVQVRIDDLMISLQAFDERLRHYADTHADDPGADPDVDPERGTPGE